MERTNSFLSTQKKHFQLLPESRSECDRDNNVNDAEKTLNRYVAPVGGDIVPVGEFRADVEMGNEESEEPLEAEIPRVRINPKNPTSREKQELED